ncbi:MAG: hypothetical protein AAF404_09185 [Pseudomonadota bacterium]
MLSENELIELLDQLKLGALHGAASETDPVGHWPVLIGDGLCLSLQSAARDEFVHQPDKITVLEGITDTTTLSSVCAGYWQVHHVSTGLHNRSIVIGYDRACLEIFPLLHDALHQEESQESTGQSSCAYDFSLAVAASLDPAAHRDGIDHPVAFLPLEFDADTRLAGGWRVGIEAFGESGEFFIGLLNPLAVPAMAVDEDSPVEAEVVVKPKTLSRHADSAVLMVTLTLPRQTTHYLPSQVQVFELEHQIDRMWGRSVTEAGVESDIPTLDLMVQKSLLLNADDLYLLLVEAMGAGSSVRLRFDTGMHHAHECVLPLGQPLSCLSINNLPVKSAELVFSGTEITVIVKE